MRIRNEDLNHSPSFPLPLLCLSNEQIPRWSLRESNERQIFSLFSFLQSRRRKIFFCSLPIRNPFSFHLREDSIRNDPMFSSDTEFDQWEERRSLDRKWGMEVDHIILLFRCTLERMRNHWSLLRSNNDRWITLERVKDLRICDQRWTMIDDEFISQSIRCRRWRICPHGYPLMVNWSSMCFHQVMDIGWRTKVVLSFDQNETIDQWNEQQSNRIEHRRKIFSFDENSTLKTNGWSNNGLRRINLQRSIGGLDSLKHLPVWEEVLSLSISFTRRRGNEEIDFDRLFPLIQILFFIETIEQRRMFGKESFVDHLSLTVVQQTSLFPQTFRFCVHRENFPPRYVQSLLKGFLLDPNRWNCSSHLKITRCPRCFSPSLDLRTVVSFLPSRIAIECFGSIKKIVSHVDGESSSIDLNDLRTMKNRTIRPWMTFEAKRDEKVLRYNNQWRSIFLLFDCSIFVVNIGQEKIFTGEMFPQREERIDGDHRKTIGPIDEQNESFVPDQFVQISLPRSSPSTCRLIRQTIWREDRRANLIRASTSTNTTVVLIEDTSKELFLLSSFTLENSNERRANVFVHWLIDDRIFFSSSLNRRGKEKEDDDPSLQFFSSFNETFIPRTRRINERFHRTKQIKSKSFQLNLFECWCWRDHRILTGKWFFLDHLDGGQRCSVRINAKENIR